MLDELCYAYIHGKFRNKISSKQLKEPEKMDCKQPITRLTTIQKKLLEKTVPLTARAHETIDVACPITKREFDEKLTG